MNLQHSHDFHPEHYNHKLLPLEATQYICQLYSHGVTPRKLADVLLNSQKIDLLPVQIQAILKSSGDQSIPTSETEELIQHMSEQQGTAILIQESSAENTRVGIITQTPEEIQNLRLFGDVVGIDATFTHLRINWSIIPITLIDNEGNLQSGGIFFAAYLTNDVIVKFLIELFRMAPQIQSLLTDQDNSFLQAASIVKHTLQIDFFHGICALHKFSNFSKTLTTCGFNKLDTQKISKLFKCYLYSAHEPTALSALQRIYTEFDHPVLKKYLQQHVEPFSDQLIKCRVSLHFTAGYNTTSICESMNHMIKSGKPDVFFTLAEMREHITRNLNLHNRRIAYHKSKRNNVGMYEQSLPFVIGKKISDLLERQIEKSKTCRIFENDGIFTCQELLTSQQYTVCEEHCQCNLTTNAGIPCSHLICLLRTFSHLDNLPLYFAPRWKLEKTINNDQMTIEQHIEDDSDIEPEDLEQIEMEKIERGDPNVGFSTDISQEALADLTTTQRYILLHNDCKAMCGVASQNAASTIEMLKMLETFRTMAKEVYPDGSPNTVEVLVESQKIVEARGIRPGRPKKGKEKIRACPLCEKDDHDVENCRYYPIVSEARDKNEPKKRPPGKARCPICLGWGHTRKTCALMAEIKRIMSGDIH